MDGGVSPLARAACTADAYRIRQLEEERNEYKRMCVGLIERQPPPPIVLSGIKADSALVLMNAGLSRKVETLKAEIAALRAARRILLVRGLS